MPLARSVSIASITAPYSTSTSALMMTIFSFFSSSTCSMRRGRSCSATCTALTNSRLSAVIASTVCSCVSGFSEVLVAIGSVTGDALLQQRSHDHHDDEQHQHDVHERA